MQNYKRDSLDPHISFLYSVSKTHSCAPPTHISSRPQVKNFSTSMTSTIDCDETRDAIEFQDVSFDDATAELDRKLAEGRDAAAPPGRIVKHRKNCISRMTRHGIANSLRKMKRNFVRTSDKEPLMTDARNSSSTKNVTDWATITDDTSKYYRNSTCTDTNDSILLSNDSILM
jgi:hypothetical protein